MKILTFLILLLPVSVFSQSVLSGKITSFSGQPFNYCKLLLIQDSSVLAISEADSLGNYFFKPLTNGNYFLQIKLPFNAIDTAIVVNGNTRFDLEIEDGNTIDEVVIEVQKPMIIRKVDRTIFDPSSIPALVGGDAADVIEFAPGVFINGDAISVTGGSKAQVMLNDKIIPLEGAALISFIRSIPSEDIQYIEVIPVPPVKYAATIQGSLINIKLVIGSKSRLSRGSVTADFGQHFYSHQGFSANYAYRKNRFSLYTNANFYHGKYHYLQSKIIDYNTLIWDEKVIQIQRYNSLTSSIGLNYELNPTTEIGLLAMVYGSAYNNFHQSIIEKTGTDSGTLGSVVNFTKDNYMSAEKSVNLNLIKRLDTLGRKIDFNVDYTNAFKEGKIDYNTTFANPNYDSISSFRNLRLTNANFFSGGIDYMHPYKKIIFNLGGRYSYGGNTSDLSAYNNLMNPTIADTTQSNVFLYNEHIQAAYTSIDWQIKRWSFQVGVRGENTSYVSDSPTSDLKIRNTYFQLIPKIFAMYETKGGQFLNVNYSRNFFRPYYSDLNPFRYYTSAFSFIAGNPYLKPTIMHNLSLSTSLNDFQIDLSLGYLNKMQTEVTVYDTETQTQQTTISNLFSAKSAALYLSYYKSINKKSTIDASFSLMYMNREVINTISAQNLNVFSGSVFLTFNQTLDKRNTFFLEANFIYTSPYLEQISLTTTRPFVDFDLKKNLLKNRMILKFQFSDPFKLRTRVSSTRSNQTNIYQNAYYDSQGIQFSFVYKLGNNNLNVNQHNTNSTGEAGRVGK